MKEKDFIQESQYSIPYHYIPSIDGGNFTQTFNWTWGINYISAIEFITNEIVKLNKKSICDVGTGDGRLLRELKKAITSKTTYLKGIDYSRRSIELAKSLNPDIKFDIVNILEENEFEKFDVITLIEVFEHIPLEYAYKFSRKVKEMLNKDGFLLITVPHKNKPLNKKHYQHFTKDSLLNYFEEGFEVDKLLYLEDRNYLKTFINIILTNRLFILNNQLLKNWLYSLYKKHCLFSDSKKAGRIYARLKKK